MTASKSRPSSSAQVAAAVADDRLDVRRPVAARAAAVEDGHRVAARERAVDERRAQEDAAAEDQDAHGVALAAVAALTPVGGSGAAQLAQNFAPGGASVPQAEQKRLRGAAGAAPAISAPRR